MTNKYILGIVCAIIIAIILAAVKDAFVKLFKKLRDIIFKSKKNPDSDITKKDV